MTAVQAGKLAQITATIADTGKVVSEKPDEGKKQPTVVITKAAMAVAMAERYGRLVGHQSP